MEKKSVLNVVSEQFPDLKPNEAKQLVMNSLNWLTKVGALAAGRLTNVDDRVAILEYRAQSIAFGVLAKLSIAAIEKEQEQIDVVTEVLQAISEAPAPGA